MVQKRVEFEEALATLPDLLDRAAPGDVIELTREGKVVARVTACGDEPAEPAEPAKPEESGKRKLMVYRNGDFSKLVDADEPDPNRPTEPREFGLFKGQVFMSDDFDEPLDDFKDYM